MDEVLLAKLEMVLKASKKDWFDDLSAEEKAEIKIGLKEAEKDEFISHDTVMNRFAKYH